MSFHPELKCYAADGILAADPCAVRWIPEMIEKRTTPRIIFGQTHSQRDVSKNSEHMLGVTFSGDEANTA